MNSLLLLFAAVIFVLFIVVCQLCGVDTIERWTSIDWILFFSSPAELDKQEKYKSHPGENCSLLP